MNKHMIEEMAKDLEEKVVIGWRKELYVGSAESLYNAGYRKIPEGAVVLTREEYEKLIDEKADNILANVDKVFKEEFADMKNSIIRRINKDYAKKVRKETAEKFARRLKEKGMEYSKAYIIGKGIITTKYLISERAIDETCKEISEGTEDVKNE